MMAFLNAIVFVLQFMDAPIAPHSVIAECSIDDAQSGCLRVVRQTRACSDFQNYPRTLLRLLEYFRHRVSFSPWIIRFLKLKSSITFSPGVSDRITKTAARL